MTFSLSLTVQVLLSQSSNLGQAKIASYTKSVYDGGTQTWDLDCYDGSYMFFANNSGLLVYDGITWQLEKTPLKTIVRSIALSPDKKKVFVGAQGEFGYFKFDHSGYQYIDLNQLIPEAHRNFSDIWELINIKGHLYFRSENKIYHYHDDKVDVIDPKGKIHFISKIRDQLIYNVYGKGIFLFDGANSKPLSEDRAIKDLEIIESLELNEEEHLILARNGLIFKFSNDTYRRWETNCQSFLNDNQIQSGHFIQANNLICIGTYLGGLAVLDTAGRLLYVLNSENGLLNNTVSAIGSDPGNNIWLGTYYGIMKVTLHAPEKIFFPDNDLKGAVFDMEMWNDRFYFATSNGLYTIPVKEYYHPLEFSGFELIEGTEGECWGLDLIDNQLFLAHNNGAFVMQTATEIQPMEHEPGVWKFISLGADKLLVGGYQGITILKRQKDTWQISHQLSNLIESSRILVLDAAGTLWMTHPYKGVFKIESHDNFETSSVLHIPKGTGIEDLNNCYGHNLNGRIIISNEHHIYGYDYERDSFIADPQLNSEFEDERLIRLLIRHDENYYISDRTAGQLMTKTIGSTSYFSKLPIIQNHNTFVGGFENLQTFDGKTAYLLTDRGVISANLDTKIEPATLRIKRIVETNTDSCLYHSIIDTFNTLTIPYEKNSIRFYFSTQFSSYSSSDVLYSYRLKGYDDNWSEWSTTTTKEFDFLPAGDYMFEARALINQRQITDSAVYHILVKDHYLLSTLAKIIYCLLIAITLLLIGLLPSRKHRKEKQLIIKQKEKIDLKVKSLELENYNMQLEAKNKELAYSTLHLLQKNELIDNIKTNIDEIRPYIKDDTAKKEIRKIISKLKDDKRMEDDWERFTTHFNKVHHNFFKRLKSEFPNLTSKDLKLCAYLRLNLSTKETAPLLGISVRGVEISRYRLRKKLDLPSEANLNDYMINY